MMKGKIKPKEKEPEPEMPTLRKRSVPKDKVYTYLLLLPTYF